MLEVFQPVPQAVRGSMSACQPRRSDRRVRPTSGRDHRFYGRRGFGRLGQSEPGQRRACPRRRPVRRKHQNHDVDGLPRVLERALELTAVPALDDDRPGGSDAGAEAAVRDFLNVAAVGEQRRDREYTFRIEEPRPTVDVCSAIRSASSPRPAPTFLGARTRQPVLRL